MLLVRVLVNGSLLVKLLGVRSYIWFFDSVWGQRP